MIGTGHLLSLRLKESWPDRTLQRPVIPSLSHRTPVLPPMCYVLRPVFPFPGSTFPVSIRASYLFPFRSFGARPSPGSRMPLQTKVR